MRTATKNEWADILRASAHANVHMHSQTAVPFPMSVCQIVSPVTGKLVAQAIYRKTGFGEVSTEYQIRN